MLLRELPAREQHLTLEVCDQLLAAQTAHHLFECLNGRMKQLIRHEGVVGGIGTIHSDGLEPHLLLMAQFPEHYISKISSARKLRPKTLHYWAKARRPFELDFSGKDHTVSPAVNAEAAALDLRNMLCHGQETADGQRISYITFIRIEDKITAQKKQILSLVMPHLHDALRRASGDETPPQKLSQPQFSWADTEDCAKGPLDLRKKQILYLIGLGKTNWEISMILGTSVNNVKYHIKRINEIFQTTNRSATVAEAIRCGEMPQDWPQRSG